MPTGDEQQDTNETFSNSQEINIAPESKESEERLKEIASELFGSNKS